MLHEVAGLARHPHFGSAKPGMIETRHRMPPMFSKSRQLREPTIDLAMQALDARDRWTASHSYRVSQIAERLTLQLDLGRRSIRLMRMAALLHDLGKIGVRDDILFKPGPLNDEDWEIIRRHPDIGADMLAVDLVTAEIAPLVRHHHERWDGTGYPAGARGATIPLGSRILAVAESFDFITSPWNPYARVLNAAEAVQDIAERGGSWYDPTVVQGLRELHEVGGLQSPHK